MEELPVRGPKITPPPAPPPGFDPDDRSWHGYRRTWKSDAIWVDLTPVRAALDAAIEKRLKGVRNAVRSGRNTHNGSVRTEQANIIGVCGEAAFARLIRGAILGRGKAGDVVGRSGDVYEVKTTFKWWPFRKFPPSANVNPRYFPKADLVLCAAEGYPECLDRVAVVAWLPREQHYEVAEKRDWGGWSFQWSDSWLSVYEIMQDELADPLAYRTEQINA